MGDIATVGLNETDRTKQNFAIRQHAQRILAAESSIAVLQNNKLANIFDYLSKADVAGIKLPDGTDRYDNLQAAITAAGDGNLIWPDGFYRSRATLIPTAGQNWIGAGRTFGSKGARIVATPALNAPLIQVNSGNLISGLTIAGTATGTSNINQDLIRVNGPNDVVLDNLYLYGGQTLINAIGTSFYLTLSNIRFGNANERQLVVNGSLAAGSPGVDLQLLNSRFLGLTAPALNAMYFNGLGSLVADNIQVSVENGTSDLISFDKPADGFGGVQWTNSVFENNNGTGAHAVSIVGTSALPWNRMFFFNCQAGARTGYGLLSDYSNRIQWIGGGISGVGPAVVFGSRNTNFTFDNVALDASGATAAIAALSASSVLSGDINSCTWGSTTQFMVDFLTTTAANIAYLNCIAGNKGTVTGVPAGQPAGIRLPAGVIAGVRL